MANHPNRSKAKRREFPRVVEVEKRGVVEFQFCMSNRIISRHTSEIEAWKAADNYRPTPAST